MNSKDKKTVIGFVGLPGSGKSTAISAVSDLGHVVTMGDVLRDELRKRGEKINPSSLGSLAKELRKKHGKDVVARKCIELIKDMNENVILVDGLRSMYEVELFKEEWKFPIISIECENDKRYKNLLARQRSDDSTDITLIKQRDKRELSFGIQDVISQSDYKIKNNSDIDKLRQKTLQVVRKIIG
ncbi:MAG: AAA family ATPase [Candidatus Lokiarchaeota archaeon]|nr:AAA family ATPase [Candidatus Lokiarchaeota archaeon]